MSTRAATTSWVVERLPHQRLRAARPFGGCGEELGLVVLAVLGISLL